MDVRIKIDLLRREKGWSRSEFAKRIGVSYTAVKNWYNEKDFMPSLRLLYEICNVFGITKTQLFAETDTGNLSDDQIELLDLYGKLNAKQKSDVIQIVRILASE